MKEKSKESVSKYGEFIPTYYSWVGLDEQKEIVNRLQNITNKTEK